MDDEVAPVPQEVQVPLLRKEPVGHWHTLVLTLKAKPVVLQAQALELRLVEFDHALQAVHTPSGLM